MNEIVLSHLRFLAIIQTNMTSISTTIISTNKTPILAGNMIIYLETCERFGFDVTVTIFTDAARLETHYQLLFVTN